MNPSTEIERRPGEIEIALQSLHSLTVELEMSFANLTDRLNYVLTSEDNVKSANSGNDLSPAHPVPMVNSISEASRRIRGVLDSMHKVHNRIEI